MLEIIKLRNYNLIEQHINEYKIEFSAKELIELTSVFISLEVKVNRIRLIGNKKELDKTKKVQIKTFKISDYVDNDLDALLFNLNFFTALITELKHINDIESFEIFFKNLLQ